jgi:prepilin-type N-terminal cleavage/methylation domain-containing protein
MNKRSNCGFTLVEIAIVLVIVGLLVGAVMKSREMIMNAKLKRVESDAAGIHLAIATYQDRYRELPGDDPDAYNRFDIYSTLDKNNVNGNGSGLIEGDWDEANTDTLSISGAVESEKIFAHLRAAGLIPGGSDDTTRPSNAYSGKIGIQNGALRISGHVTIFGNLDGSFIKIIESRLDDGEPDTGRIQADTTDNLMTSGSLSRATKYNDANQYNVAFRL